MPSFSPFSVAGRTTCLASLGCVLGAGSLAAASPFADKPCESYSSPRNEQGDGVPLVWGEAPLDDFGSREVAFDRTSVRCLRPAPPPGVHPRIFFGPDELGDVRRRVRETRCGQEAWKNILSWTAAMKGGYFDNAEYALPDRWNGRFQGLHCRVPLYRLGVSGYVRSARGAAFEGEAKNQLGMDGAIAFARRTAAYGVEDLGGHPPLQTYARNSLPHSRNAIMLAGAGRIWSPIGSHSFATTQNSVVAIDGASQQTGVPGGMVDVVDAPLATFAVGDTAPCWSLNWKTLKKPVGFYTLADVREERVTIPAGWEPERRSANDFVFTKRDDLPATTWKSESARTSLIVAWDDQEDAVSFKPTASGKTDLLIRRGDETLVNVHRPVSPL